jgi:hypothetical protein
LQAAPGEVITANPERNFGRSCRTNARQGPSYAAEIIFETGIVEENHCGAKLPPAQPGLLVLVFRRSTFLEALGEN